MWLCKSMSESSWIIFVLPCNKGVVTMHILNKPLDGLRAPDKVEWMFVPKHVLHSSLSYLIPLILKKWVLFSLDREWRDKQKTALNKSVNVLEVL